MKENGQIVIGIDACRNRSGGAVAHLVGILTEGDPFVYNIGQIHVWAYKSLLDMIPDRSYIIKHNPKDLEGSLIRQLWWQAIKLKNEAEFYKCDILFTTDASTLCRFKPNVVLSQDLLSYVPGMMKSFGITIARLRLLIILFIQNNAFRFADGVIFLTKYASEMIQKSCGTLSFFTIIPHGVSADFKNAAPSATWPVTNNDTIECVYVSNAELYKHQWNVIGAVAALRQKGYNINIKLIGGGTGTAQKLIDETIAEVDPDRAFVTQFAFLSHREMITLLEKAHILVFASSCENMPVTLVEYMTLGLPIACSDREPMPEVLSDGGVYFDPYKVDSISHAIEKIIVNPELRSRISRNAKDISQQYSWSRCASETFSFVVKTFNLRKG